MKFVRGDSLSFKFLISLKEGEEIQIEDIEELYVTCRQYPNSKAPILFQKELKDVKIENGYCHVVFEPKDTENLEYGLYYFDTEITLKNGYRKTRLYTFTLTEETTIHGGEAIGK